jgi:hypothetical protein
MGKSSLLGAIALIIAVAVFTAGCLSNSSPNTVQTHTVETDTTTAGNVNGSHNANAITPSKPQNTTLTLKISQTEVYTGDPVYLSGRLVDANGNGIPNQTISLKNVARVMGFTTDWPMNDTTTDSTGAFTYSEPVTRHDAPSFITEVDLEVWAVFAGNELYNPATSPHISATIHLT